MTPSVVVFLCALVVFGSVAAVDYIIILNDKPVQGCPGKENSFYDKFFDTSNILSYMDDDDTTYLDGSAKFIGGLTGPLTFKMNILQYMSGRWIDTGFTMNRPNICSTFFDEDEIWHPFVSGLPTDCPPNIGETYEFHNRSMNIVVTNLSPSLEGLYRAEISILSATSEICASKEGELIRK